MTGPSKQPNSSLTNGEHEPVPSARAELLRAAADGDTTAHQAAAIEKHLRDNPDDASVIEFERQLRRSVASLGANTASDQLRQRVCALAAAPPDEAVSPIGRISLAGHRVNRWLAIAASLVIVAGGGYAIVQTLQSGVPLAAPVALDDHYRAALVSFVGDFNEQCELHTEMAMNQLKVTTLSETPAAFAEVMGASIDIGSIAIPEFHFLGGGRCSVPGGGKSFHLVFESDEVEATRRPVIGIFIQQDTGEMKIDSGPTYRLLQKSGNVNAAYPSEIYVWRKDGFVYFLVSTSQPALTSTLKVLGVDEPTQSI